MGPAEIAGRGVDTLRHLAWSRRQVLPGAAAVLPADLVPERTGPQALPPGATDLVDPAAAAALIAAAESVLAGTWSVFGVARTDSADPDWFADPVTSRRAPQHTLCFRVQHRDEASIGNVKQIWELSRHHHLTVLAAAYWLSGEEKYAQNCADQLRSWWRANPNLSGVHWTSGIEVGIRLLSWVWVRRLLADWPKVGDLFEGGDDALRQIAWHCEFLSAFPSRGSSANNHLIAEAAGQLAASSAFAWYRRSADWRREAADRLERAVAENTFTSGLNRELASEYHGFVADLTLLGALEADAAGHPLAEGTWQRLAAMLDTAASVVDVAGRPPRQGDGDEGRTLVVDDPHADAWTLTLDAGRAVLGADDWWPATRPSVRGVLLGSLAAEASVRPRRNLRRLDRPRNRFADAGMVLLTSREQDGPQLWCRTDAGPHGFGTIAGHAHADALAIEVRHDGVDILADPGTYCYHGEPLWRQHFRSTAAHNTLELAGQDSSTSGGPFLWTRHATSRTVACEASGSPVQTWTGEHDGYRHLAGAPTHRRHVELDSPRRTLTVRDIVVATAPVDARLTWQLGPRIDARLHDGSDGPVAELRWSSRAAGDADRTARLHLPGGLAWSVHRGETDPIEGWFSPGFGTREPATALIGRGRIGDSGGGSMPLITALVVEDAAEQHHGEDR